MSNKTFNPYQNFSAVRTPEMFFGRALLLRRIYSAIESRQCLSLVGTRHIGKSSVLAHMYLPEVQRSSSYDLHGFIFVQLDLRDYRQKTSEFFFESVSERIIARCHDLHLGGGSHKGADQFSFVLAQIVERGFYTVLLLDAFDNIMYNEHFDLDFFSFLRAQTRYVSYVTASVAPLQDICRQDVKQSPFFNIFSCHEIGPLTSDEAHALVTIPTQQTYYSFTDSEVEWILSLAGRHPFFIQRVCHWLLEEKYQQDSHTVDLDTVKERVYKDLHPHFKALWGDLSESQQKRFETQIQQGETQQKILPELYESALFRRFVCEADDIRIIEITTQITAEEVEKLLDSLDSLQRLGESNMRYLKIVSTRLKNHSITEAGKVIREILKEAFEHTRGSGTIRQDSASDWRFYNILYYRYFGPHYYRKVTSEQLAARLNYTSTRNYFRDRKKAIEALLDAVLEMEQGFST